MHYFKTKSFNFFFLLVSYTCMHPASYWSLSPAKVGGSCWKLSGDSAFKSINPLTTFVAWSLPGFTWLCNSSALFCLFVFWVVLESILFGGLNKVCMIKTCSYGVWLKHQLWGHVLLCLIYFKVNDYENCRLWLMW